MKPHRVRMAHSLILHYGLYSQMDCYRSRPAESQDMTTFHSEDYVAFLKTVTQDREAELRSELQTYNLLEDCPVFDGLWDYCRSYAGGSIGAAVALNYGSADIAVNWAGGLHHGKKSEASGFCYINDIVLAILELLKYHQRVLYVDIDIHHGDGVEEAFLTSDRVMTLSLHKFGGGFFPNTGDIVNKGHGRGQYYAVNAPLKDGITDEAYQSLFRPVLDKIMQVYRPEVVVLQCGADSLAGDRIGVFNVSSAGHAACVEYVKSFNLPMMLLGGGGYTIVNVARCWAKETGVALGLEMDETLPVSEYDDYYGTAEFKLTVPSKPSLTDENSKEYLDGLRIKILEQLSHVVPAPSVAFHERAPDAMSEDELVVLQHNSQDNTNHAATTTTTTTTTMVHSPHHAARRAAPAQMWRGSQGGSQPETAHEAEEEAEFDRRFDVGGDVGERDPRNSNNNNNKVRVDISYRDGGGGSARSPFSNVRRPQAMLRRPSQEESQPMQE